MNTVKVKVDLRRVHIPALSTIGYGYGQLEDGTSAVIIADRRAMEGIGRAIGEGKPPIVVYAEVVATGEIADGIAEQWHDQWAISDTESDLDQSLPAPEDVPCLRLRGTSTARPRPPGCSPRRGRSAKLHGQGTRRPRPEQWPPSTRRQRNAGVAMQRRWGPRGSPTSRC